MCSFQLFLLFFFSVMCGFSSTRSIIINGIFSSRTMAPYSVGFNQDLVESVSSGAEIAIHHCQKVFKWDKWNCPEVAFVRRQKSQPPTRESAYVHAILSAGVVYAVSRNCSRNGIKGCGCKPHYGNSTFPIRHEQRMKEVSVDWIWGGCSDNTEFGEQVAEKILDETERGRDVNAYINLHNNMIGRAAVRESMVKRCRCHGVSGSCALQICWMQLPPFSEIARRLREMYEVADKVDYEDELGNSATVNIIAEKVLSDNSHKLVYTEKSPNYCLPNNLTGWKGTKGRSCSRSKSDTASLTEKRSCRNLCRTCGHRVRKQKKQVTKRCNCIFKWCCEVKCDICTETVEEYFCD